MVLIICMTLHICCFKEAKVAAEALNNVINVAVAHRMIGQVYSSLQNYDLAIKHELKYLGEYTVS